MSDRAQKLQKLHVQVCSVAPDMSSAKHMREATRNLLGQANAYGPLILQDEFACLQGNPVKISYLNFLSFLHFCYKSGGSLHQQLCNITEPLGLLVYTGEIVPGNPLATQAGHAGVLTFPSNSLTTTCHCLLCKVFSCTATCRPHEPAHQATTLINLQKPMG